MNGFFVPPTHVSASTKLKFMCLSTHEIELELSTWLILCLCTGVSLN